MRHLLFVLAIAACAPTTPAGEPFVDHDEPADFEPAPAPGKADGLAAFNLNDVYSDAFLTDTTAIDAAGLQAFFERTPYGTRSWLADATIDDKPAAQAIVDDALAQQLNPLVLVARMQVESSLVSQTKTPSSARQAAALGCGCPDGGGCSASYKGLARQLTCGAEVLRKWYDASEAGDAQYEVGKTTKTLDGRRVTPKYSGTATLYAYTPWVLPGSGGTWLVWNVTKKYVHYAVGAGLVAPGVETE